MTVKIDKAGRLILTQSHPGPARTAKTLGCRTLKVKTQGLWVHTGKLPGGYDIAQSIRDDRDERIRSLATCEGIIHTTENRSNF
jgi:hypothetical protein